MRKNFDPRYPLANVDMALVENICKLVKIEFAVNNGFYHQVYNPKGLTELIPELLAPWFGTPE